MLLLACAAQTPTPMPDIPLERDGWIYTVDVAQLALAAVRHHDEARYDALHAAIVAVIHDDPHVPFDRGMVDWRRPAAGPWTPDASGTTEGMRVAEALWEGATAFDRPEDRTRALLVLDGWARHARVDNGVWMVANYFDFGTRAFARNSFLIDYDPDFVAEVARETGRADYRALADAGYALIERAVTPVGLLYDVVQPEMATLMGPDAVVFSPNDIVLVHNSAAVAEQVVRGRPGLARGVLAFARSRHDLRAAYYGRDGAPVPARGAATTATWAALCRVAQGVGTTGDIAWACGALPDTASDPWTMSELLLARPPGAAR